MARESISYKLDQLANEFYISYGSTEQQKIDNSVNTLKSRLKSHFGSDIQGLIEFGSYKRDTILPRKYDEHSDVDLMILFNHDSLNVSPGTYRNYLINFADKKYSRSDVYKSSPTVVLELEHIKYDLVPSYEQIFMNSKTIYIPQSDSTWMTTDPNGFSTELTRINTDNSSNIKKVIRLLKAWNAKVGYPINSFILEQEVAKMDYSLWGDRSLERYFFSAIEGISAYRNGIWIPNSKITALKDNAKKVNSNLELGSTYNAMTWLAHILPI